MLPSHQPSQALTSRPTGTYMLHTSYSSTEGYWRAVAYRDGRALTIVRAATQAAAVSEARRNVRIARKAGGL